MNHLDRICVSSWSFHNLFASTRYAGVVAPAKDMDILDFPEMIADRFHVHNIEIVSKHLLSTQKSYFAEFNERVRRAKSRLINIPVDIWELWDQPSISSPDPAVREHALNLYLPWVDHGAALGTQCIRCDPGILNLDDPSPTIASYRTLVAATQSRGLQLVVENHGRAAAFPDHLVEILRATGAGALPDIGNFPNDATRIRGLEAMFPLAKHLCHAKYEPDRFDFTRCIQIAKNASFPGVYSVEAPDSDDPWAAVQSVIDKLAENC